MVAGARVAEARAGGSGMVGRVAHRDVRATHVAAVNVVRPAPARVQDAAGAARRRVAERSSDEDLDAARERCHLRRRTGGVEAHRAYAHGQADGEADRQLRTVVAIRDVGVRAAAAAYAFFSEKIMRDRLRRTHPRQPLPVTQSLSTSPSVQLEGASGE